MRLNDIQGTNKVCGPVEILQHLVAKYGGSKDVEPSEGWSYLSVDGMGCAILGVLF